MKASSLTRGTPGLVVAIVLTVVLFNLPWGRLALYPFALLSTWFHEMGHGMTALILGGDFKALVLRPDTSGFALYDAPQGFGALRRAAISSAGYLGTAVVGAGLLTLRRWPKAVPAVLGALAAALALSGLLVVLRWPSDTAGQPFAFWLPFFGVGVVTAWAVALAWVAARASETWQHLLFNLIAAQTALNAVLNVRVLFFTAEHSDADSMADLLFVPSVVWASLWLVAAVALAGLGFWAGLPRSQGEAGPGAG